MAIPSQSVPKDEVGMVRVSHLLPHTNAFMVRNKMNRGVHEMEQVARKHIEDLEKEIKKIDTKLKYLSEKISSGTASDKDVANLVELSNQKRERKFSIFNIYQIIGKVSQ